MVIEQKDEKEAWDKTLELMGEHHFELGPRWTESYLNEPERLGNVLSYYKAAAKMVGEGRAVLELGCGEGLGGVILGEQARTYVGVDRDAKSIEIVKRNLPQDKLSFKVGELKGETYGEFDGVVALDVHDDQLIEMAVANLGENGVCVMGRSYVEGFQEKLQKYFHQVFPFGMNDEVICTGPRSGSDYLLCVACFKKG